MSHQLGHSISRLIYVTRIWRDIGPERENLNVPSRGTVDIYQSTTNLTTRVTCIVIQIGRSWSERSIWKVEVEGQPLLAYILIRLSEGVVDEVQVDARSTWWYSHTPWRHSQRHLLRCQGIDRNRKWRWRSGDIRSVQSNLIVIRWSGRFRAFPNPSPLKRWMMTYYNFRCYKSYNVCCILYHVTRTIDIQVWARVTYLP